MIYKICQICLWEREWEREMLLEPHGCTKRYWNVVKCLKEALEEISNKTKSILFALTRMKSFTSLPEMYIWYKKWNHLTLKQVFFILFYFNFFTIPFFLVLVLVLCLPKKNHQFSVFFQELSATVLYYYVRMQKKNMEWNSLSAFFHIKLDSYLLNRYYEVLQNIITS